MNYSVIILAAGKGSRMNLGYNKMFLSLNKHPLLTLSSRIFIEDTNCNQVIYVVNEKETSTIQSLLNEYNLFNDKCVIVNGGSERQFSVNNGLELVSNDIVLIHDAARPFISKNLINSLLQNTLEYGCVIPAVKVKDTIKIVENNIVIKTLPRQLLYSIQTPQACKIDIIKKAHALAKNEGFIGTDEASLIEKYNLSKVKTIESSYDNFKITTKDDIQKASFIYPKFFNQ